MVDDVLGGELELSRDVVLRERGDIFAAVSRVGGDEIRADARGDEDVADAGEVAELLQEAELRTMVRLQRGTAGREEARL